MNTMDLGLAALVADAPTGSVVPAVVAGLALAGVGLAVITNLRGEPLELASLPKFNEPKWADELHPEYPLLTVCSPAGTAVYQDWLLERPEPEAREAGTCLALRAAGEPCLVVTKGLGWDGQRSETEWHGGTDRIVCENVRLVGRESPAETITSDELIGVARKVLTITGYDAEAILPLDDTELGYPWPYRDEDDVDDEHDEYDETYSHVERAMVAMSHPEATGDDDGPLVVDVRKDGLDALLSIDSVLEYRVDRNDPRPQRAGR
jgi:hypothetical protein